jgi:hypothetical protein
MNRFWVIIFLLVTSLSLSCGSGSHRQLQSITIKGVANGAQIQFTATGTFSAPPTTVTPLPVSWSLALRPPQYSLTTQPFVFNCAEAGLYVIPIVAMAPADPQAPSAGSTSSTMMVSASGPISCL